MSKYVVDTHILLRFMTGVKISNHQIHSIMEKADQGENTIVIPSVVLFEIAYLNEKSRIPITLEYVSDIIENSINYVEEVVSKEIIKSAFEIKDIPELHDRLIAGTARYCGVPLLTNDSVILKSKYVSCIQ